MSKNTNYMGLIAKIDYLRPTLLPEPIFNPFPWKIPWELYPKVRWMDSRAQKVKF